MTAQLIARNAEDRSYFGTSADEKPASGVVPGSLYTETDTGRVWIWDEDNNEWVRLVPANELNPDTVDLLRQISETLLRVEDLLTETVAQVR